MSNYREERQSPYIILWDDEEKVGLRFEEGRLAVLDKAPAIVYADPEVITSDDWEERYPDILAAIEIEAKKRYPKEFEQSRPALRKFWEHKDDKYITLWSNERGIGLRFIKGMKKSLNEYKLMIKESDIPQEETDRLKRELLAEASLRYPNEFR